MSYYIYAYLREDGTPYYIGKGKGRRCYATCHAVSVPKDRSKIVIMEDNLTNVGACALERRYIRWYGKKIDGGILRNITDGGEGNSAPRSKEWRENHSRMMKENNPASRPEVRKKMSEAVKGKKRPAWIGQRISEAKRAKKALLASEKPSHEAIHCNSLPV